MTIWRLGLSALHAEHVVPRGSTGPDLIDEAFLFLEGISFDAIHVFYKYQYQSTNWAIQAKMG